MGETKDGRAERLKAALRDNLRRRKAQERARAPEPGPDGSAAPRERDEEAGSDHRDAPDLNTTRL